MLRMTEVWVDAPKAVLLALIKPILTVSLSNLNAVSWISLWLWGLPQEVSSSPGGAGGEGGESRLSSLPAHIQWGLGAASLSSRQQRDPHIQTWAVCGENVTLKIKSHGAFKCWTQGEGEICVIEAFLSLSPSPLPLIVSSIIWVIWSWGHKFLYNSNPLCREEASGNYSYCIPDPVPKVLEQIRPSISAALLSIFR